jgi:hypothetical protein
MCPHCGTKMDKWGGACPGRLETDDWDRISRMPSRLACLLALYWSRCADAVGARAPDSSGTLPDCHDACISTQGGCGVPVARASVHG